MSASSSILNLASSWSSLRRCRSTWGKMQTLASGRGSAAAEVSSWWGGPWRSGLACFPVMLKASAAAGTPLLHCFTVSHQLHPAIDPFYRTTGMKPQTHQNPSEFCRSDLRYSVRHFHSPDHKSDWPAGPSRLHPPELCNNPETETESRFQNSSKSSRARGGFQTFLMTSICSSLHSGLFFFALTKKSMTRCSSWSVASATRKKESEHQASSGSGSDTRTRRTVPISEAPPTTKGWVVEGLFKNYI